MPPLLQYYVDDLLGIWNCSHPDLQYDWIPFKDQMNTYVTLKRKFSKLSTTAVLLDIRINLYKSSICTSYTKKERNFHLFLIVLNTHPTSVLTNLVTRMILCIRSICSENSDYDHISQQFYRYLTHHDYEQWQLITASTRAQTAIAGTSCTPSTTLWPIILQTNYFPLLCRHIKHAHKACLNSQTIKRYVKDDMNVFGTTPFTFVHHCTKI